MIPEGYSRSDNIITSFNWVVLYVRAFLGWLSDLLVEPFLYLFTSGNGEILKSRKNEDDSRHLSRRLFSKNDRHGP